MNSQLSVGEQICQDFAQYLKDLEQEGRCLFLPFEIHSLSLKNIGKFSERYTEFGKFNVIFGRIGAGKTTIFQSFVSISGSHRLLKNGQNRGEIDLTLSDGALLHQDIFDAVNVRCIVLDDAGERLARKQYGDFLGYLQGLNVQMILTTGNMDDDLKKLFNQVFPDCKFLLLC